MREPRTWRSAQPEGLVLHLRLSLVQAEGLAARRVASGVRKAELVPRKQERQRASLRDDGGRRRHPRVADAGRCAGGVESVRERRRARSSALAVSEGGEETRPGEVEGGAGGLRHAARAERPRDRRGRGARRGAQSPRREVGRCSGQAERLSHPQASLVVVDGEARVGVGDRAALGVVAREEPLLLAEGSPSRSIHRLDPPPTGSSLRRGPVVDRGELPRDVVRVLQAGVHAEGARRRELVRRVAQQVNLESSTEAVGGPAARPR